MLNVRLFEMEKFLNTSYEEELTSRLQEAQEKLQTGSGAGGEFTGWVHLPESYDREEFARILAAAKRIQSDSQALVVVGIGGSYLGARGVIDCLCSPNYNLKKKSTPNVYFIGNGLSADALQETLDLVSDVDFSVNEEALIILCLFSVCRTKQFVFESSTTWQRKKGIFFRLSHSM